MNNSEGTLDCEIARLAIPAFATLLAEPLYILTDTAIVGHLGTNQLAGLALASTVLLSGYAVFIFLAYGTTASVARLLGADRRPDAARHAVEALWLALILGIGVTILGWSAGPGLLGALGGSGAVLTQGWIYLRVSLAGTPALLLALAGTGYLRGLQDMRTPLVVTLGGVSANLVIEVVLIFGLGFGIGASALASVMAQWGVAAAYLWFIARDVRRYGGTRRPRLGSILTQMRIGADLLVRTVALRATLVVATAVAAGMGTAALAAHQIVFEVWNFLAMMLDSVAIAAQALIGRLLGRGDRAGARNAGARMLTWSVLLGVLALGLVLGLSGVLGRVFSSDPEVLGLTSTLLVIAAVWQPVNSVAFTLDGILIGAGDTKFLALSMLMAAAGFIPLALWVERQDLGIGWLWGAMGVLMALRALTLGWRFLSGRWAATGATVRRVSRP